MSKLTDTLRTALEPLKFLINRVDNKIDQVNNNKAENVDWKENDPKSHGYIRNRPFYDSADGTVQIPKKFIPTGEILLSEVQNDLELAKIHSATETPVFGGNEIREGEIVYIDEKNNTYYKLPVECANIDLTNDELEGIIYARALSPDGSLMILSGDIPGYAKVYKIEGETVTYISDIYADNNGTPLSTYLGNICFSPDSSWLLCRLFGGKYTYTKMYRVNGENITYIGDNDEIILNTINGCAFSPDSSLFVASINTSENLRYYKVEDGIITYISPIYADDDNTILDRSTSGIVFSPDGSWLVVTGFFTGYVKAYKVNEGIITYVSDIYADNDGTPFDSHPMLLRFSPDGSLLLLGNRLYTVGYDAITYVSDIYSDDKGTPMNQIPSDGYFSPDGSLLILTGSGTSTGYVKVYKVEGETVTYISDIYADNTGTPFRATGGHFNFSPDGSLLVFVDSYAREIKEYRVENEMITYICSIQRRSSSEVISRMWITPDGSLLIYASNSVAVPQAFKRPHLAYSDTSNATTNIQGISIAKEDIAAGEVGIVYDIPEAATKSYVDSKPIPTTVPQVQTASVGQTVVVKAVDENGKPTEWEAKDMSSGGAEGGGVTESRVNELISTALSAIPNAEEASF